MHALASAAAHLLALRLVGLYLMNNHKNDTEEDLGFALTIIGFAIAGRLGD